ncbi:MAG: hypothetical protein ACI9AP_001089 [Flavobacteriales bacterium]|jgi:hypothetical protein
MEIKLRCASVSIEKLYNSAGFLGRSELYGTVGILFRYRHFYLGRECLGWQNEI